MSAPASNVLSPPAPLERLLVKLDAMPTRDYRAALMLSRGIQRRLELRVGQHAAVRSLAERLLRLCDTAIVSPGLVALAINLCRERLRWENRLRGPDTRVSRKVLFEELLLLKRTFQSDLKLKPPFPVRRSVHGTPEAVQLSAYIDASVRPGVTAMGILVQDPNCEVIAELSIAGAGTASDQAEVQAAVTALRTLRVLGASSVMLCTDSDTILDLLAVPPRVHKPLGFELRGKLLQELEVFRYAEVLRIPRAYNHHTDRLAAKVLSK